MRSLIPRLHFTSIMLNEIIINFFLFAYATAQCLPLEWDTSPLIFSTSDFTHLSIPDLNSGEVVLRSKNGFEGDFVPYPCHTTVLESPVCICLDPVSDVIFLNLSPFLQDDDYLSRCIDAYPNTCILTVTETLLIDLPDDQSYNGMFFGCEGFPQTTFIDLEYFSEPEKSIFDLCSIPPPVLGCGKYLRQVTIQPPFF